MKAINRTFFLLVFVSTFASGCSTVPTTQEEDAKAEFVPLFDGHSLNGWHTVPARCESAWSINDGVVVGEAKSGCVSYLVFNDDALTDFELEGSYRFPGRGNSGIEIHAVKDASGKRAFIGYHADLGHVGIGPQVLGAWDFHFATREEYACFRGTSLVINPDGSTEATPIDEAVQPSDINRNDWNRFRVIANGRHYQFFINGKLASEFTDNALEDRRDEGAIALQLHDPGMRVEFKDLRLKNTARLN